MASYITTAGDTFDSVAYNSYGDEEMMVQLIEANPEYVETAVFSSGVELEVPEIEKTDSDAYLPPWRK